MFFVIQSDAKGPITWRISARAEISPRLGGLKFQPGFLNQPSLNDFCDYMKKVSARDKGTEKPHVIKMKFQPGLKSEVTWVEK